MTLTRARTVQYIGILLSLGLIAVGYWYFSVRAGVKTNTSVSQPQGNGRLDSGLAAYYPLDNGSGTTATDMSVNGNNGTLTNGPTWGTGQIGSAVTFDGTNDYIDTSSSVGNFGTNNFSIGGWIKTTSNGLQSVMSKITACTHGSFWYINMDDSAPTKIRLEVDQDGAGTNYYSITSNAVVADNTWHHFVFTRVGATLTVYIDGSYSNSGAGAGTTNISNATNLKLATSACVGVDSTPLQGSLDEIRIYDHALSSDEISQLYRLTTPTSVDTSLKGYWSFEGQDMNGTTAYDRSGAGNNGVLTNGPTKVLGRVGQAVNFDGSNDYVEAGSAASLDNFTNKSGCAWIYPQSGNAFGTIMSKSSTNGWELSVKHNSGSPLLELYVSFSGTDGSWDSPANAIKYNTWQHICFTYNNSSTANVPIFYIDGAAVPVTGGTPTGTADSDAAENFEIGILGGASEQFTGKIDEVRYLNRILAASEVRALYDVGNPDKANTSTSQTEGTGRLSSGLVGYWPLDNGSGTTATDASVNGNNGTLNNGPLWTTGQIGSAVDFDGVDDYIQKTDTAILDFGDTDNFTLAGWFNRDTATTDDVILAKRTSIVAASAGYIVYLDATTDQLIFEVSDGTDEYSLTSTSTFTTTGWHHFAIVWDQDSPGNSEIYIDGAANSATDSGTIGNIGDLSNAVSFGIGVNSLANNPFDGKIDEVRVYDRALSPEEISRLYQLTIPTAIDTSLRAYWSFDGQGLEGTTLYDLSGGRGTGTLTNGPTKSVGRVGQGLDFDGTNDHVAQVSNSTTLAGISQATVAFWLFPRTAAGYDGGMFATIGADGGGNGPFTSGFEITGDITGGTRTVRLAVAGSVDAMIVRSSGVLPRNTWTYVVVVWDGTLTAANTKFYFDGSPVSSVTLQAGSGTVGTTAGNFNIGSFNGGTTTFDGKIDELRVYNRQLSAAEIKSLYDLSAPDKANTSISQPQGNGRIDSGLSGYWKLDENTGTSASDSSPAGNTGTFTNGPVWSTGQIGSGVTFDGVNDYIDVGDIAGLDGAKAMTAAAWVKTTSSNEDHFLDKSFCDGGTGGGPFELYAQAGEARFVVYGAGGVPSAYDGVSSGTLINDNAWHYIAGTYDGLYIRVYVDGVESGAVSFVNASLPSNSYSLSIGGHCNGNFGGCGGDCYWPGQVDEARIYNRALSGPEIYGLYRTTGPNGIDSSLKGYWSFNGQDMNGTTVYDRSGAGNNGTITSSSTKTVGKLGQALEFFPNNTDSNDYVDFGDPASGTLDFGSGDFSAGFWMLSRGYVSQGSSINAPLGKKIADTPGSAGYQFYYNSSNILTFAVGNGTTDYNATQSVATTGDSQWHHYVGVRSGSNVYLYVDGVLAATTTSLSGSTSNSEHLVVATTSSLAPERTVNGKIDELRIYNRALTAVEIQSLYNQSK